MLTICDLLYKEIVWNKEKVMIKTEDEKGNIKYSDVKRLEFHYEAIDNNYTILGIEPEYDEVDNEAYLILFCEVNNG